MGKNEFLDYIADYAVNHEWQEANAKEQIRALFVSWCLVFCIDADSKDCDRALQVIYWRAALENSLEYEEFENYMLEFLV